MCLLQASWTSFMEKAGLLYLPLQGSKARDWLTLKHGGCVLPNGVNSSAAISCLVMLWYNKNMTPYVYCLLFPTFFWSGLSLLDKQALGDDEIQNRPMPFPMSLPREAHHATTFGEDRRNGTLFFKGNRVLSLDLMAGIPALVWLRQHWLGYLEAAWKEERVNIGANPACGGCGACQSAVLLSFTKADMIVCSVVRDQSRGTCGL